MLITRSGKFNWGINAKRGQTQNISLPPYKIRDYERRADKNILNHLFRDLETMLSRKTKEFIFENIPMNWYPYMKLMDGRSVNSINNHKNAKQKSWIWLSKMMFGLCLHAWDSCSSIKIETLDCHIVMMKN